MTSPLDSLRTRRDFRAVRGMLLVLREAPVVVTAKGQPAAVSPDPAEGPEVLLAVANDGRVIALHGHVDLGTGLATALAQIVAEELDVALDRVSTILGDTARAPNQGATIASASIQVHATPLRLAAAQARAWLVARAADRFGVPIDDLVVHDGVVSTRDATRSLTYGALIGDAHVDLMLDPRAVPKAVVDYTVVGTSMPRVDIPAKVMGETVFVHDLRMPGLLHGRVIRPPYAGADHGDFIGNTLASVDEASIADVPGLRAVVVIRDFVGVVCDREEHAEFAASRLAIAWKPWPSMPATDDGEAALRDAVATCASTRTLVDEGDVDAALARSREPMTRTYLWPYQLHASIGPSCAVAHWKGADADPHALTVWAGTQNPHVLRRDLALLCGLDAVGVEVIRMEAAGCYGRNGADDVAADAALLSRAVSAPVRVQLTREQEHLWEPKGAAQWMQVRGGIAADGSIAAYDFAAAYPSNGAPTLALLLTRTIEPHAQAYEMGDRTARPPYAIDDLRVTVHDVPPLLRASWLRGVSAMPNSFAHESFVDECAVAAGQDPVAYRLAHLTDPRARELIEATAAKAGWKVHTQPQAQGATGDVLHGQGVAYARYVHSAWPGYGAAWSAWIADVDVDRRTGEVHVRRVVVGQDAGLVINPAGVGHQVQGNVVQTVSRSLLERVRTDAQGPERTHAVAAREWGSYPLLSFREVPVIEVVTMPRPHEAPLGVGESASVPGTAAIANAIFDATGVRFRAPPFTAEVVRAALQPLEHRPSDAVPSAAHAPSEPIAVASASSRSTSPFARWALVATGAVVAVASLLGVRSTIAPVVRSTTSPYASEVIERGRALAAIGNCAGCHTVPDGPPLAGGRSLDTPFGAVVATNITPDVETGIGSWSFSAFQRAMREGIARDGRHLYPAFPYPSYTHVGDDDLTALYAWLMAQPPVSHTVRATRLAFPFNVRPLMAAWNGAFLSTGPLPVDASRSPQWNRGRDLVEGLGHCGACHTERNVFGAERERDAYLGGAMVDGWHAPSLTATSRAPVAWTEQALFDYLRTGYSIEHGSANGPMAPVVRELSAASDDDVRAMAHYVASFSSPRASSADEIVARATISSPLPDARSRFFASACGACHHDGDGPMLLGVNVPLALSTKLHADRPDSLVRVILEGVREPAGRDVGFMPSFATALDDRQVVELVEWMRTRFAPGRAAWTGVDEAVRAARGR